MNDFRNLTRFYVTQLGRVRDGERHTIHHATLGALMRRGLVYREGWRYHLTAEGWLTLRAAQAADDVFELLRGDA